MVDERDLISLMEDEEAEYYEELLANQKQQVADAKAESEKLEGELKETQAATQEKKDTEYSTEMTETGNTEEPAAEKNSGKSKAILIMILIAALGFCVYLAAAYVIAISGFLLAPAIGMKGKQWKTIAAKMYDKPKMPVTYILTAESLSKIAALLYNHILWYHCGSAKHGAVRISPPASSR